MAHNSPPAHSFPQTPITWLVTGSQAPRRLEHDLSPGLKVATMTWDGLSIRLEVVLRALKEKPSAQVAVLSALPGSTWGICTEDLRRINNSALPNHRLCLSKVRTQQTPWVQT